MRMLSKYKTFLHVGKILPTTQTSVPGGSDTQLRRNYARYCRDGPLNGFNVRQSDIKEGVNVEIVQFSTS